MSTPGLERFSEIWLVDFEFCQPTGEVPRVLCMVAREWRTGRTIRSWVDQLGTAPPNPTDHDTLFIAYYASAELGCYLSLSWPMPTRIVDLFVEFRCLTNGLALPCGSGLLGALAFFGLDSMDGMEKESMRKLAMWGGRYSRAERTALLDYCERDVLALDKLLSKMAGPGRCCGAGTWPPRPKWSEAEPRSTWKRSLSFASIGKK